ncbi:MAG: ABC transporter ATP-binding protein [bacterium]|nr:ABC transporter ATP-binding protein [bacterium]
MKNNIVIEAKGIVKRYAGADRPAVDALDLVVPKGSFFGLLGPNGAGKTTLISMMTCLAKPDEGSLMVCGLNPEKESLKIKEKIGFVPQEIALYPTLTARENLAYFGSMQGLSGDLLKERISYCLDVAKLHDYTDICVYKYSGGLKRRLAIVVGLINSPEILFLDEPTVGIDPQSRHFIYDRLIELNKSGMTILYTSHYMEEVEYLCNEIAIIDQGNIIACGGLDELLGETTNKVLEAKLSKELSHDLKEKVESIPMVTEAFFNSKTMTLCSPSPNETMLALSTLFAENNIKVLSMSHGVVNLEQLFIALTGSRLRE